MNEPFEQVYDYSMDAWESGLAIRRDWPDGSHELVGFNTDLAKVERFLRRDRAYWRHGPEKPVSWEVVWVSRRDFSLHASRSGCRAPDCPSLSESLQRVPRMRRHRAER